MLETQNIHSLTDFLRNHKSHMARIKETRLPEALTVNGKAEVVLMDAETYQEMANKIRRIETIEAIREGMAAVKRGDVQPADQFFEEMFAKYGIQD